MMCALAMGAACSRNTKEDEAAEPVPPTILKVENQAFLDMTIYVYRSSQRIRLGIANGNSTALSSGCCQNGGCQPDTAV